MPITPIFPQPSPENWAIILTSRGKDDVKLAITGSAAHTGDVYLIILPNLSFNDVSHVDEKTSLVVFVGAFAWVDESARHRADATDIAALNIAENDERLLHLQMAPLQQLSSLSTHQLFIKRLI